EKYGDFGSFGGAELHRRVRFLAMDGDLLTSFELDFQCHRSQVNQHSVADVMPVVLKNCQSASREEAAEKRKPRRSMKHSARRSMEIPDHGPCIFYDCRREGRNSYQSPPGTPLIDKKGIWRDEEGRPCSLTEQLINVEGSVIPDVIDVAEMNTFSMTSKWYDSGSEDPFNGLSHEDPKDLIKRLEELASANKHDEISADHIICKIFPYCLSRDAFSWFSKLQPRSLTCWEDIKEALIGKFFSEVVATRSKRLDKMIKDREKGIMISMSQILDFIYSEENGDIGTPTTHVKQPDIQVHHADKREQIKVEEADTKDPTSASIDSSNSESIDICTSETIDTDICHRSIPSTIPDATTVYVRTGRPKAIRDYNIEVAGISDTSSSSIDTLTITSMVTPTSSSIDPTRFGKRSGNSLKADNIDRHKPDEIDRHPPYDIDLQSPSNIDQHTPECIARYPHDCIDRRPCLDELSGYMIEPELVGRKEHTSGASHLAVPENLRPPLCEEEAFGICKRVKRIHDPVKFVVPYEVFEAESPIPPDKSMELSSYGGVFDDNKYVEASQRGLRLRDEVDNCPAEVPSSDINRTKSIDDTIISSSIDTGQIPSTDTLRESEQKEFEVCQNLFDGGTTMRSDKSGGKKRQNWKKRKRIKGDPQLSLIHHFSDGVRKPRVRSRCFSQPFAKLKALLIAEMIDKGEGIDRQSINNIDHHLTVLPDTHIQADWIALVIVLFKSGGDQSRRLLSTSTDDTSSISIDSTSSTSIDCLFIVSIDTDVKHIVLKILKWINLSTMFTLAEISGQSASREEAAEKRKPRRSMQHSARRSMEIPDRAPCIFYDCVKPRSHKLSKCL
ncbi:hypothetical protein IGI04_002433, partial [Brassica rapa subsp. trilocularis]